jgi:hypothetical protein
MERISGHHAQYTNHMYGANANCQGVCSMFSIFLRERYMRLLTKWVLAMSKRTQFHLLLLVLLSVLIAQPVRAATGVTGQVGNIEILAPGGGAPGNYDFRVSLTTGDVICNGQNWAYLNTTDANYSALVASILSAKALGGTVTLYGNVVGMYCQLAYVVIN